MAAGVPVVFTQLMGSWAARVGRDSTRGCPYGICWQAQDMSRNAGVIILPKRNTPDHAASQVVNPTVDPGTEDHSHSSVFA
jgi:hypothetical protein